MLQQFHTIFLLVRKIKPCCKIDQPYEGASATNYLALIWHFLHDNLSSVGGGVSCCFFVCFVL